MISLIVSRWFPLQERSRANALWLLRLLLELAISPLLVVWLVNAFGYRAKGIDFEALSWPLTVVFIASVVGTIIMGIVGDRLGKRSLIAAIGCGLTGLMIYIATTMQDVQLLVFFFACAVFFQSTFTAQEYAIIQR
ncbi:MAG: MFS transporter [Symploca sp. SIO1B1]|nr:MFS transporter [Symploca sp. SIO1B1]